MDDPLFIIGLSFFCIERGKQKGAIFAWSSVANRTPLSPEATRGYEWSLNLCG